MEEEDAEVFCPCADLIATFGFERLRVAVELRRMPETEVFCVWFPECVCFVVFTAPFRGSKQTSLATMPRRGGARFRRYMVIGWF